MLLARRLAPRIALPWPPESSKARRHDGAAGHDCDRSTRQYTEYRRSNRLFSGTSVTSFFCPFVWKTCGLSVGLIHEAGSVSATRNVGISRSGMDGVRLTAA